MIFRNIFLLAVLFLGIAAPELRAEESIFLREDFKNLQNWKPLTLPSIKSHTKYEVIEKTDSSVLKISSNASASGLILKQRFSTYDSPVIRWKWKVKNIFKKGNGLFKNTSDFPLRLHVLFEYNPKDVFFLARIPFQLLKGIYGEYPPHSSLDYVWANKAQTKKIFPDPATSRSMVIPMDSGAEQLGTWCFHEVNILEDYQKAFGKSPPKRATIAIMSDSDNTGESTVSFIDHLEILNKQ